MIAIHLPFELVVRVAGALKKARQREVGGMLMGEHLGESRFRIVDLSIQTSGGGKACFVRDPRKHEAFIKNFFERTGKDFTRFNYLGEWHSHPNHLPLPSRTDRDSMREIVEGSDSSPLFAILIIFRMDRQQVAMNATAYRRDVAPEDVDLIIEHTEAIDASLLSRIKQRVACLLRIGKSTRQRGDS